MSVSDPVAVRPLRAADIDALAGVLARAYDDSGDHFRVTLERNLTISSSHTFVAHDANGPAGMVIGNDYGSMAYVALMAVDPALQRRGIGTALMDALIGWAEQRAIACLELDASDMGAPLYERYGFLDDLETHIYTNDNPGSVQSPARRYQPGDLDALLACDRAAFGADRGELLERFFNDPTKTTFVDEVAGEIRGFAGSVYPSIIGPVIASNALSAARLFATAHAAMGGPSRACIPSRNAAAIGIATALGFTRSRSLRHMIRGTPAIGARGDIYARINLGQG